MLAKQTWLFPDKKNACVVIHNSISIKLSFSQLFKSITSHNTYSLTLSLYTLPRFLPSLSLYTIPRFLPSLSLYTLPHFAMRSDFPTLPHSPSVLLSLSSFHQPHCLTLHQSSLLPTAIDYRYIALLWYIFWFWLILGCVLCEILIILLKLT